MFPYADELRSPRDKGTINQSLFCYGKSGLQNLIKKVLWPVLSKPWDAPDMEFHYGLWNGVSALYSEGRRQLGEENTRPFALNHHIPAETLACKYEGSRKGRLINISALRTAMQNFDAALNVTAAVRRYHLERQGDLTHPGIWDLYIMARASIALIAYQRRFLGQDPPMREVSDILTSQFQFISGVFMICRQMMETGDNAITANNPIAAQDLYDYADSHGIFISFNDMACAGSTKKILEFLEFCNAPPPVVDPGLDLADLVSRPDNWYSYAIATIELDCLVEAHRFGDPSEQDASARAIFAKVRDYAAGPMVSSMVELESENESLETQVLRRQNYILSLLGRPPITSIPKRHFAQRLEQAVPV